MSDGENDPNDHPPAAAHDEEQVAGAVRPDDEDDLVILMSAFADRLNDEDIRNLRNALILWMERGPNDNLGLENFIAVLGFISRQEYVQTYQDNVILMSAFADRLNDEDKRNLRNALTNWMERGPNDNLGLEIFTAVLGFISRQQYVQTYQDNVGNVRNVAPPVNAGVNVIEARGFYEEGARIDAVQVPRPVPSSIASIANDILAKFQRRRPTQDDFRIMLDDLDNPRAFNRVQQGDSDLTEQGSGADVNREPIRSDDESSENMLP